MMKLLLVYDNAEEIKICEHTIHFNFHVGAWLRRFEFQLTRNIHITVRDGEFVTGGNNIRRRL